MMRTGQAFAGITLTVAMVCAFLLFAQQVNAQTVLKGADGQCIPVATTKCGCGLIVDPKTGECEKGENKYQCICSQANPGGGSTFGTCVAEDTCEATSPAGKPTGQQTQQPPGSTAQPPEQTSQSNTTGQTTVTPSATGNGATTQSGEPSSGSSDTNTVGGSNPPSQVAANQSLVQDLYDLSQQYLNPGSAPQLSADEVPSIDQTAPVVQSTIITSGYVDGVIPTDTLTPGAGGGTPGQSQFEQPNGITYSQATFGPPSAPADTAPSVWSQAWDAVTSAAGSVWSAATDAFSIADLANSEFGSTPSVETAPPLTPEMFDEFNGEGNLVQQPDTGPGGTPAPSWIASVSTVTVDPSGNVTVSGATAGIPASSGGDLATLQGTVAQWQAAYNDTIGSSDPTLQTFNQQAGTELLNAQAQYSSALMDQITSQVGYTPGLGEPFNEAFGSTPPNTSTAIPQTGEQYGSLLQSIQQTNTELQSESAYIHELQTAYDNTLGIKDLQQFNTSVGQQLQGAIQTYNSAQANILQPDAQALLDAPDAVKVAYNIQEAIIAQQTTALDAENKIESYEGEVQSNPNAGGDQQLALQQGLAERAAENTLAQTSANITTYNNILNALGQGGPQADAIAKTYLAAAADGPIMSGTPLTASQAMWQMTVQSINAQANAQIAEANSSPLPEATPEQLGVAGPTQTLAQDQAAIAASNITQFTGTQPLSASNQAIIDGLTGATSPDVLQQLATGIRDWEAANPGLSVITSFVNAPLTALPNAVFDPTLSEQIVQANQTPDEIIGGRITDIGTVALGVAPLAAPALDGVISLLNEGADLSRVGLSNINGGPGIWNEFASVMEGVNVGAEEEIALLRSPESFASEEFNPANSTVAPGFGTEANDINFTKADYGEVTEAPQLPGPESPPPTVAESPPIVPGEGPSGGALPVETPPVEEIPATSPPELATTPQYTAADVDVNATAAKLDQLQQELDAMRGNDISQRVTQFDNDIQAAQTQLEQAGQNLSQPPSLDETISTQRLDAFERDVGNLSQTLDDANASLEQLRNSPAPDNSTWLDSHEESITAVGDQITQLLNDLFPPPQFPAVVENAGLGEDFSAGTGAPNIPATALPPGEAPTVPQIARTGVLSWLGNLFSLSFITPAQSAPLEIPNVATEPSLTSVSPEVDDAQLPANSQPTIGETPPGIVAPETSPTQLQEASPQPILSTPAPAFRTAIVTATLAAALSGPLPAIAEDPLHLLLSPLINPITQAQAAQKFANAAATQPTLQNPSLSPTGITPASLPSGAHFLNNDGSAASFQKLIQQYQLGTGVPDSYPWPTESQQAARYKAILATDNPGGMKWAGVVATYEAKPSLFNIIPVTNGVPDISASQTDKINLIPCNTPYACFASFSDAVAMVNAKFLYQPAYASCTTYGCIENLWVKPDALNPTAGSAQEYIGRTGLTNGASTAINKNNPTSMAPIDIGIFHAEYPNYRLYGITDPSTGAPITDITDLVTPQVVESGLEKVYGAAAAQQWYQTQVAAAPVKSPVQPTSVAAHTTPSQTAGKQTTVASTNVNPVQAINKGFETAFAKPIESFFKGLAQLGGQVPVPSTPPKLVAATTPTAPQQITYAALAKQSGTPQIPGLTVDYLSPLGNPANANPRQYIIIHQTESGPGTALSLAKGQNAQPTKVGAEIYVETDGTVYWATPENTNPGHVISNRPPSDTTFWADGVNNANTYHKVTNANSIGIEFAGNAPNVASPPTAAQVEALKELIPFLQQRYNISPQNIYAHDWVAYKDERYCEGCSLATVARNLDYIPNSPASTVALNAAPAAQPAPTPVAIASTQPTLPIAYINLPEGNNISNLLQQDAENRALNKLAQSSALPANSPSVTQGSPPATPQGQLAESGTQPAANPAPEELVPSPVAQNSPSVSQGSPPVAPQGQVAESGTEPPAETTGEALQPQPQQAPVVAEEIPLPQPRPTDAPQSVAANQPSPASIPTSNPVIAQLQKAIVDAQGRINALNQQIKGAETKLAPVQASLRAIQSADGALRALLRNPDVTVGQGSGLVMRGVNAAKDLVQEAARLNVSAGPLQATITEIESSISKYSFASNFSLPQKYHSVVQGSADKVASLAQGVVNAAKSSIDTSLNPIKREIASLEQTQHELRQTLANTPTAPQVAQEPTPTQTSPKTPTPQTQPEIPPSTEVALQPETAPTSPEPQQPTQVAVDENTNGNIAHVTPSEPAPIPSFPPEPVSMLPYSEVSSESEHSTSEGTLPTISSTEILSPEPVATLASPSGSSNGTVLDLTYNAQTGAYEFGTLATSEGSPSPRAQQIGSEPFEVKPPSLTEPTGSGPFRLTGLSPAERIGSNIPFESSAPTVNPPAIGEPGSGAPEVLPPSTQEPSGTGPFELSSSNSATTPSGIAEANLTPGSPVPWGGLSIPLTLGGAWIDGQFTGGSGGSGTIPPGETSSGAGSVPPNSSSGATTPGETANPPVVAEQPCSSGSQRQSSSGNQPCNSQPTQPAAPQISGPQTAPSLATPPQISVPTVTPIPTQIETPSQPLTNVPLPPSRPRYAGVSIVDYLNSIGAKFSYATRSVLAASYGIANYIGSAAQNLQLLKLIRGF